jgi:hypothetical protein
MNWTNMKTRFIARAVPRSPRVTRSVLTLYCCKVRLPREISKTWEVPYTKVEGDPIEEKWRGGKMVASNQGFVKSSCHARRAGGPRGTHSIGIPTKVDLHVRHVTSIETVESSRVVESGSGARARARFRKNPPTFLRSPPFFAQLQISIVKLLRTAILIPVLKGALRFCELCPCETISGLPTIASFVSRRFWRPGS